MVRTGGAQQIDDVATLLRGLSVGPYPELPKTAFALSITQPGSARPAAVMVVGVSARLMLTDPYRGFLDLVAAAIGTALANARAYEEERRRAEILAEIDRAKTVLLEHQPRVPHPADADAGPAGGRARRACRPAARGAARAAGDGPP